MTNDAELLELEYTSVKPDETGATFQLSRETYKRLANAVLSLARCWPESSLFIRPLAGTSGCAVDLYTANYLFAISIGGRAPGEYSPADNSNEPAGSGDNPETFRPMRISLVVAALDYPNSEHLLFAGQDTPSDWERLRFAANRIV